jgi:crossover junction endodeoxyribonuclease RuvC
MKIMGLDPGTARIGWSVIEDGSITQNLNFGCIETDARTPMPKRLLSIFRSLNGLIEKYNPDCMSLEELYFATNAKTAITVGQARGVILLAAEQNQVPVISYTPLVVKQAVTGNGHAGKPEVEKMVMRILHLKKAPKPDDVTDALAIALTHAFSYKMRSQIQ